MAAIEWDPWLRFRDLDFHEGQQLAWMQHLAAGWKPGHDLCLSYGPLNAWSQYGFMRLTSWSVVGLRWYFWLTQSLGAALAWTALQVVGASTVGSVAGLALYLLFSPAWLHWYGFANGLRQTLALVALVAAIAAFLPPFNRRRAAGAGLLLGTAACYSPEAGLAAMAGVVAAAGALRWSGYRIGRTTAWTTVSGLAVVAIVLALGCSGSPAERVAGLFETSRQFLHGFLTLPYLAGPVGRLVPGLLLASTSLWLAARMAGVPIDLRAARHLGILVFGWAAFRALLGRSDLAHAREAVPAVIVLVVLHAEAAWRANARIAPRHLRDAWRTTWIAAVTCIGWFAAVRIHDALHGGAESVGRPNLLRSKSPSAWRIATDMQRAGLRVRVDLPRIGGLWLTPGQARTIVWLDETIARRTRPGDAIFAGPGAELAYFVGDRLAASRYPVPLHAIEPAAQAALAASLAGCRIAVTNAALLDDRPWDWWLPQAAMGLGRDFIAADRTGSLTLWVRRGRSTRSSRTRQ